MKRLLQLVLALFAIIPSLAASLVSGYYVLQDWGSLNRSFARCESFAK